jgi:hypothetical protein
MWNIKRLSNALRIHSTAQTQTVCLRSNNSNRTVNSIALRKISEKKSLPGTKIKHETAAETNLKRGSEARVLRRRERYCTTTPRETLNVETEGHEKTGL